MNTIDDSKLFPDVLIYFLDRTKCQLFRSTYVTYHMYHRILNFENDLKRKIGQRVSWENDIKKFASVFISMSTLSINNDGCMQNNQFDG